MTGLSPPVLLTLVGVALLAVAIFAPRGVARRPGVSLGPPLAAVPVERWTPPPVDPLQTDGYEFVPPHRDAMRARGGGTAAWPELIDPRARGCDVATRLALVDALARVGSPWARDILRRGYDDEPNDDVRSSIAAALGGERATAV